MGEKYKHVLTALEWLFSVGCGVGNVTVEKGSFVSMGMVGSQEGLIKRLLTSRVKVVMVTIIASSDGERNRMCSPWEYLMGLLDCVISTTEIDNSVLRYYSILGPCPQKSLGLENRGII